MKKQREAANFRAKPAAILEREPFRPKPSEKLPTALDEEFQLNSDRRAAERILFDEKVNIIGLSTVSFFPKNPFPTIFYLTKVKGKKVYLFI